MPIYFVRISEGNGERQDLDMLLTALEKRYEVITFNVIEIIADDARVDPLLRDLAIDLGQGRKAIFEKMEEARLIKPAVPKNGKDQKQSAAITIRMPKEKATVIVLDPKNCLQCGAEFQPRRRGQVCCSKACGKKYSQKQWLQKRREGDGIKQGSLVKQ